MKIILIDDEPLILGELSYLCEKHKDIEICGKFVNPKQALQYVAGHPVDFAFCDIRMPGIYSLQPEAVLPEGCTMERVRSCRIHN